VAVIRTMLRPVARVAAMHAAGQARAFLRAHERTAERQESLLLRMVAAAVDSQFGRDHGFGRIRSYSDFAGAVPVGDYETHRPYVDRVLDGQVEALFAPATRISMFAVTSGTTGAPKHIPVTPRFLADYRRGWNIFGLWALRDHPRAWLRKVVTIASSARESLTARGVPCGAVSGTLAEAQKWIVRRMYPVPGLVREVRDPLVKYYLILRASIGRDVGMLTTANPSSAVKLAEVGRDHADRLLRDVRDGTVRPPRPAGEELWRRLRFRPDRAGAKRLETILARHGELLPKHYWDLGLLCHWTGGTVGLYLPRVRELYGDVPIRDIGLLASEGRLSVPMRDHTAAGVAEITSNFLEFIPADQAGSASPDVLRAHQIEPGGEYFVILTNWAGLWRYNIDDRVRVTDRLGQSPVFEFLSKGLHTCSITGEKLTEHQVVEAMRRAAERLNVGVDTFALQGHFADPPYYRLETQPAKGIDPDELGREMDRALREINVEYDAKRAGDRLGPVRAALLPPGSFERQQQRRLAERHGRSEQYKHKYLLTEVVEDSPARR